MADLRYFLLSDKAQAPSRGSELSVGYDVYSPTGPHILSPGETIMIDTEVEYHFAPEYELQVRSRSGLSLNGLVVANSPGTIDPDYTGSLKVIIRNSSDKVRVVEEGNRIAQIVLQPRLEVNLIEGRVSRDTARGSGGFGSTGK